MKVYYILLTLIVAALAPLALAQTSLSVNFNVGLTTLVFSGRTFPNAFISFVENDAVIGTTNSDANGNFTKEFTAVTEGEHNIYINSSDATGILANAVKYDLITTPGEDITIENIILPPTINIKSKTVTKGESIKITGYSVPNTDIAVYIDNKRIATVESGDNGFWNYLIRTSSYSTGSYKLKVKASEDGYTSFSSLTKTIEIKARRSGSSSGSGDSSDASDDSSLTTDTGTNVIFTPIPESSTSTGFLDEFAPIAIGIINSIKIDLSNLFEVISLWLRFITEGNIGECDLNSDLTCDLVDFSIIMYRVGR